MLETAWRPARRLRHLESISIHNFFHPAASFDSTTAVLFDLLLVREDAADELLFVSEQILIDPHLEWDSINLRDNTKLSPAVLHQPFTDRLRVVVRAAPPQRSSPAASHAPPTAQSPCTFHTQPFTSCIITNPPSVASPPSPLPARTASPVPQYTTVVLPPQMAASNGTTTSRPPTVAAVSNTGAGTSSSASTPGSVASPTGVDAASFTNSFQRSQLFGDSVGQLPGSSGAEAGSVHSSFTFDRASELPDGTLHQKPGTESTDTSTALHTASSINEHCTQDGIGSQTDGHSGGSVDGIQVHNTTIANIGSCISSPGEAGASKVLDSSTGEWVVGNLSNTHGTEAFGERSCAQHGLATPHHPGEHAGEGISVLTSSHVSISNFSNGDSSMTGAGDAEEDNEQRSTALAGSTSEPQTVEAHAVTEASSTRSAAADDTLAAGTTTVVDVDDGPEVLDADRAAKEKVWHSEVPSPPSTADCSPSMKCCEGQAGEGSAVGCVVGGSQDGLQPNKQACMDQSPTSNTQLVDSSLTVNDKADAVVNGGVKGGLDQGVNQRGNQGSNALEGSENPHSESCVINGEVSKRSHCVTDSLDESQSATTPGSSYCGIDVAGGLISTNNPHRAKQNSRPGKVAVDGSEFVDDAHTAKQDSCVQVKAQPPGTEDSCVQEPEPDLMADDSLADSVLEEDVDAAKLMQAVPEVGVESMLDNIEHIVGIDESDSLGQGHEEHHLQGQVGGSHVETEGAVLPEASKQAGLEASSASKNDSNDACVEGSAGGQQPAAGGQPERGEVLLEAEVDLNQLLFLGLDARSLKFNCITTNTLVLGLHDGFYTPVQPSPPAPPQDAPHAHTSADDVGADSQDVATSSVAADQAEGETAEGSSRVSDSRAQTPELPSPTDTASPSSGAIKPSLAQQQSFYRWMLSSGSVVSPMGPLNNSWDAEFDNVVRVHLESEAKRKRERQHTRSNSGSQLSSVDASPSRQQRPARPSLLAARSTADVSEAEQQQRPSTGNMLERRHDVSDMRAGIRRLMEARQKLDTVLERRDNIRDKVVNLLDALSDQRDQQSQLRSSTQQLVQLQRRVQRCRLKLDRLRAQLRVDKDKLRAESGRLITCSQALVAAMSRLCEAAVVLSGEQGWGAWKKLHAQLVAHRCRCVVQLAALFQIGPITLSHLEPCPLHKRLEHHWWAGAGDSAVHPPNSVAASVLSPPHTRRRGPAAAAPDKPFQAASVQAAIQSPVTDVARLTISGLELPSSLTRRGIEGSMGWSGEPDEEQRVAAALGYSAQVVKMLGVLLDVPLRYPIRLCLSTSKILDGPLPLSLPALEEARAQQRTPEWAARVKLMRRIRGSSQPPGTPATSLLPATLPLHYDGADRTRFAYAIFLLNKNIEQLLSAHGLTSVGPSHVLHNLYNLVLVAASAVSELPPDWPPTQPPVPSTPSISPSLSRRASADSIFSSAASSALGSRPDLNPAPRQFSLFGGRPKRPAGYTSPDIVPRHKSATTQHSSQLQNRLSGGKAAGPHPDPGGLSRYSTSTTGLHVRGQQRSSYSQPTTVSSPTTGMQYPVTNQGLNPADPRHAFPHHNMTTVSQGFWSQESPPPHPPRPPVLSSTAFTSPSTPSVTGAAHRPPTTISPSTSINSQQFRPSPAPSTGRFPSPGPSLPQGHSPAQSTYSYSSTSRVNTAADSSAPTPYTSPVPYPVGQAPSTPGHSADNASAAQTQHSSAQGAARRRTSPFLMFMQGPAFRPQQQTGPVGRTQQPPQSQSQPPPEHHTYPSSKPHPNWR